MHIHKGGFIINFKKSIKFAAIPLALSLFLVGCSSNDEKEVVGTISGTEITKSELLDFMLPLYSKDTILTLLQDRIVSVEAEKLKIVLKDEDIEKELAELKNYYGGEDAFNDVLKTNKITEDTMKEMLLQNMRIDAILKKEYAPLEEDLKNFYDGNKENYQSEDKVSAYHILLETEEEAKKVIKELQSSKNVVEDFKKLAKELSKDEGSAAEGGFLGEFVASDMVEEFSNAAFALKENEFTTSPVKTEYGYHVIYSTGITKVGDVTFEDVKSEVESDYYDSILQDKYDSWFSEKMIEYKAKDVFNSIDYKKVYEEEKSEKTKETTEEDTNDSVEQTDVKIETNSIEE